MPDLRRIEKLEALFEADLALENITMALDNANHRMSSDYTETEVKAMKSEMHKINTKRVGLITDLCNKD